ncbi:facilitated trehalose transporter Tret1-like [Choristoneura fumiferana]|uniref:facilitated trehalose transporter Tret1-like n=1 Tax=Choristoneura fumiferana TaxID=7141 RepID=UPI003D15A00B
MIKINGSLIRQYAVVITVNLSILCSGLTIAWPSPVLVKLRNETLSTLSRPITEEEGSWIVSIGSLTGIAASFLTCYLVDRVGRKYTVIISYLPRLVMCVIMVFASEVWMILVGRALCGVADTFIFTVVPMYASEIASKEVRGSLGTFLQILASIGILIMLCSGPFMEYLSVNIMVLCFSIVTLIPLFFLPESPYFLYSKGRKEEALKVLLSVRDTETAAKDELKEFSLTEKDAKISKRELFRNKTFIKSASIAIIIGIGSQLIGFNAVSFYLQTVLESTQTNVSSEIASGVIGCIQLLAAFSTTLITDRFGRKPILASTLVGQAVGMIGLGVFYKLKEDSTGEITGYMNYVPLISLIIVVYSFSAGLGSLTWCLLAELFDGRGRAIGVTISMNISIIFMFLTVKYFAMITTTIGYATTYGIFSVNCVLMCLFICFCVPETKGKSIAEIQAELGSRDVSDVKGGNC